MKNILILIVLVFIPLQVKASSLDQAIDFDYTGNKAQNIDFQWFPSINQTIGGPGGNDVGGIAQQFTLALSTNISYIDYTATTSFLNIGQTTFTYDLYSQSTNVVDHVNYPTPVPVLGSFMLQSDNISLAESEAASNTGSSTSISGQVPFNVTLQPGTYWIAEQGAGGAYVTTTQHYIDPPFTAIAGAVPTPEPSTWILLFLGSIGCLLCKRKFILSS